mmetsp:Transcript_22912/g.35492  ORF Transcript_22912/g.35492 Transcript_22912/m.35492 type:complete len:164 (-) Transcript_22912:518-1009(-)
MILPSARPVTGPSIVMSPLPSTRPLYPPTVDTSAPSSNVSLTVRHHYATTCQNRLGFSAFLDGSTANCWSVYNRDTRQLYCWFIVKFWRIKHQIRTFCQQSCLPQCLVHLLTITNCPLAGKKRVPSMRGIACGVSGWIGGPMHMPMVQESTHSSNVNNILDNL